MNLTQEQISAILRWAETTPQVEAVRVFGSPGKGSAGPSGDLDIAITASTRNYYPLAGQWEAHLREVTGLKVKINQYNNPISDEVRTYCDEFSILLFARPATPAFTPPGRD